MSSSGTRGRSLSPPQSTFAMTLISRCHQPLGRLSMLLQSPRSLSQLRLLLSRRRRSSWSAQERTQMAVRACMWLRTMQSPYLKLKKSLLITAEARARATTALRPAATRTALETRTTKLAEWIWCVCLLSRAQLPLEADQIIDIGQPLPERGLILCGCNWSSRSYNNEKLWWSIAK